MRFHHVAAFLLFLTVHSGAGTWWYLSQYEPNSVDNPKVLCSSNPNLDGRQRRMCRRRSDMIWTIGKSTRDAIAECQFQFQFYKWNCSTVERDSSVFGKMFIKGGTPELAFVQAITAASAVLGISKACSLGTANCGCALNMMEEKAYTNNDFKMNGCTESTKFALHFVHRFGDGEEIDMRDPKARMTVYNNKAGRVALVKQSLTRCKCHGLSGSCTMRTCWRFLPNLRVIGNSLKNKYDGAIKVDFDSKGQMMTVDQLGRKPTRTNLIYFEDSPNGCILDYSRGLFGTSERLCNSTSEGIDSCHLLCCENEHTTTRVSITYKCECTFQWCCEVKCKVCQEWKAVSRCRKRIEKVEKGGSPLLVAMTNENNSHSNLSSDYFQQGRDEKNEAMNPWVAESPPEPTTDLFMAQDRTLRINPSTDPVASSRAQKRHRRWNVIF